MRARLHRIADRLLDRRRLTVPLICAGHRRTRVRWAVSEIEQQCMGYGFMPDCRACGHPMTQAVHPSLGNMPSSAGVAR